MYFRISLLSILDIAEARQSCPDTEPGKNIDVQEKPGTNNGKDENQLEH
jgi:hypothetical protein